ncbi:MAG: hypothetical protein QOE06_2639 [Thermoleophilaceae bacterium]|jgi:uncharacterized protein (DUF1800 family)|nr:hypothetical protein [Thermoleophilaceae bacterium]
MDWTEAHVRRLFWRAGFGATPEEAAHFAQAGMDATLRFVLRGDGGAELVGPAPTADGKPLDPVNEWGHDVLWWLDRMVRTRRPLVEKMTLFWHDHFATSEQETPYMLRQNKMLRRNALGSFRTLVKDVTRDPAMQLFLSLAGSTKWAPNENYARELMELFTLGSGYTERDIREAARALTGFEARWTDTGFKGIRYRKDWHDSGQKRIFGKRGNFAWGDVCDLVCDHRSHAPFLVEKLWKYFVTEPLDSKTRRSLVRTYTRGKLRIEPVVGAILAHPALYARLERPDMVKSPVVYLAGALRAVGGGVQREAWTWLTDGMGQQLFSPPSVAGWDWGPAWLSTNTMKSRFEAVTYLMTDRGPLEVPDKSVPIGLPVPDAIEGARAATGRPWTSPETDAALERLATTMVAGLKSWERQTRADHRQRALRHLLLSGPDAQLH